MFKKEKPWYADGLKFQCSMCGNCCSGPEGEIPVLLQDRRRLAKHLGLSLRAFNQHYTTISKNTESRILKMNPTPGKKESLDCIFLDPGKNTGKSDMFSTSCQAETVPGLAILAFHFSK